MKHKLKIYKLHFTTPLHISNERDDYAESLRTMHSEMLYAALTASLAKIGYEFENDFNGDLGFSISSLFPFYQETKETKAIFFFPKSRKIEILPEDLLEIHKDVKKIQWYDISFFEKLLKGDNLENFYAIKENEKYYLSDKVKGSYLTNTNIPKGFISSQVFPHAKVSRTGQEDTKIYYMERIFFQDYSGLYFIVAGKTDLLEKGLKILQHEGIGTDRNVGNGFFEWEKDEIELDLPENTDYSMNLSLFLPEKKEQLTKMLDEKTAYSFKKRGGWVTTSPHNTIRKNRVHMFEEGSVFKKKTLQTVVLGRIADLTPDLPEAMKIGHSIFRSGKSLFIPINLKEEVNHG